MENTNNQQTNIFIKKWMALLKAFHPIDEEKLELTFQAAQKELYLFLEEKLKVRLISFLKNKVKRVIEIDIVLEKVQCDLVLTQHDTLCLLIWKSEDSGSNNTEQLQRLLQEQGIELGYIINLHVDREEKVLRPLVSFSTSTQMTKTFLISILQRIHLTVPLSQALILASSNEVCQKIGQEIISLDYYKKASVYVVSKEINENAEGNKLQNGEAQIIVGTPEMVYIMLNSSYLMLNRLKIIVVEETDKIIDLEMRRYIPPIFKFASSHIEIALFSSTISSAYIFQNEELTLEGIKQFYIMIEKEEWKLDTLLDLYDSISKAFSIKMLSS